MADLHTVLRETHHIGDQTHQWIVWADTTPALRRHHLQAVGFTDAAVGFEFVRTRPTIAQLLVCHGGHGQALVNGSMTMCSTGMAYLTPANVPHAYRATSMGRWQVLWMIYDDTQPSRIASPVPVLTTCDPRPLHLAVQGLYQESIGARDLNVIDHWLELAQHYASNLLAPLRSAERLWKVWARVDGDLRHPWTIAELTRIAGISGEHLRRLCLQDTARSPMEHVAWLRMRRAAAMLATTTDRVADVAVAVGYDSPFAFSHAFKRYKGSSPAAYRTAHLKH